jgi:hypothetical protein
MTGEELADAARVSRYLVYKHEPPFPPRTYEEIKSTFHSGLLALQVIKPLRTLGIVFYGHCIGSSRFSLECIERRPPMEPYSWALKRTFDRELVKAAPSVIESVLRIMMGPSAERRNAFLLLQLGLEHFHPLIAGLLWVMGLEAILNSANRNDFKEKICARLGPSTRVFPDWHGPQPDAAKQTGTRSRSTQSRL